VSFLLVEVGGWTAEDAREQAENLVGACHDLAGAARRPHLHA
jgi:hypothetical protein